MAKETTKLWLTPKRLARGPEKADEEIRRWAKTAFRPAKLYGSVTAMREDAVGSRSHGVGSKLLASEPQPLMTWGEFAALGGCVVGAFFIGRWLGRKYRTRSSSSTAVHGAPTTDAYLAGIDAVAAL